MAFSCPNSLFRTLPAHLFSHPTENRKFPLIFAEMDEFVWDFKKLQTFIERLKGRVEAALNEKDALIAELREEIARLDGELKRTRAEREELRGKVEGKEGIIR